MRQLLVVGGGIGGLAAALAAARAGWQARVLEQAPKLGSSQSSTLREGHPRAAQGPLRRLR